MTAADLLQPAAWIDDLTQPERGLYAVVHNERTAGDLLELIGECRRYRDALAAFAADTPCEETASFAADVLEGVLV